MRKGTSVVDRESGLTNRAFHQQFERDEKRTLLRRLGAEVGRLAAVQQ